MSTNDLDFTPLLATTIFDGTGTLDIAVNKQERNKIMFAFVFHSSKIHGQEGTVKAEDQFQLNFDESLCVENIFYGIVNGLLHEFYDQMILNSEEESVFCDLNNMLPDNISKCEQGRIYYEARDQLYHKAPLNYSGTDIVRILENKIKEVSKNILRKIKGKNEAG